jgi:hypothetical protein
MPPSAIIDSCYNGSLFVLEERKIWKATGLGGGNAAWEELASLDTLEADDPNMVSGSCKFTRIINYATVIWALMYGQTVDHAGTQQYKLYCWRSLHDGGGFGIIGQVCEFAFGKPNYYLTKEVQSLSANNVGGAEVTFPDEYSFRVKGYFTNPGGGQYHHQLSFRLPIAGHWHGGDPSSLKVFVKGEWTPWNLPMDGCALDWDYTWWESPDPIPGEPDHYGYGAIYGTRPINNTNGPWQRIRFDPGSAYGNISGNIDLTWRLLEVNGVPVSPFPPTGFAVAPNPNWLYCSVGNIIYRSISGGWLWGPVYSEHGALDICVDPQLSGAIYYISTEGKVNLMVMQSDGTGLITDEGLDAGLPEAIPLRLKRDSNSGKLWHLNGGSSLKMRNLAQWTVQKTGLAGARGLNVHTGGKMIFVDGSNIYVSEDYGTTVRAVKGNWAGFSGGVNGHRK